MSNSVVVERLISQIEQLPVELQRRVLEFAQALALSQPRGSPGKELLHFAGSIAADDIRAMADAIEDGCERVDASEW